MNRLWPQLPPAQAADPLEIALAEIDVAIELVRRGQARRVRLCGLTAGERAAGEGLARAQAAGVGFAFKGGRSPNLAVNLVIGPAIDD